MKTVLLGLSGGVDSAVAALLLKKQGYRVIGAFMKNFSDTKNKLTGECAYVDERAMAQKIAALLDIDFITLDFEKEYKKYVVDSMFKAHRLGLTPNPDASCNATIKFPLLWKEAKKRNIDYIATGHYIRKVKTRKGWELYRAKDESKDQSYFLYTLTQKDLEHTFFPIGEYTKEEIRAIAKKNKFPNYDKKSSRGICFVGKVDMKSFLRQKINQKIGLVITTEGKIIGKHPGMMYYTIGERVGPHSGFDIDSVVRDESKARWYIAKKDIRKNILIVAPKGHPSLKTRKFSLYDINLINPRSKLTDAKIVRIRHLGKLWKASISKQKKGFVCTLNQGLESIAPGQSVIAYRGKRIIGGGEIRLLE